MQINILDIWWINDQLLEMDMITWVQILDEAICISYT